MLKSKRQTTTTILNKRVGRKSGVNSKCKLIRLLRHHVNQEKSTPLNLKYYNHNTPNDKNKSKIPPSSTEGKKKGGMNIKTAQGNTRRSIKADTDEQLGHVSLLKQTTDDLMQSHASFDVDADPPHMETYDELLVRYEALAAKYKQQSVIISHLREGFATLQTNFEILSDKNTLQISAILNYARHHARTDHYIDLNRNPNVNSMIPSS